MSVTEHNVGAWAPNAKLLDALVQALRRAVPHEVLPCESPKALMNSADQIAAAVLFAPPTARPSAMAWPYLQELGDRRPLLLIGSEPPGPGVTMWLPTLPSQSMLGTIVAQLLAEGPSDAWARPDIEALPPPSDPPPSGPVWRRKADMILGESRATRRLLAELERLAPSNALVLVTGESGTGKELVARALHHGGPRADQPFVAVNCAALPEPLVEAELFGYQRGAFTGAVTSRAGAFEAAQRGTLLLDEIGEMPRGVQPKLLRILETNEFSRLGSSEVRKVEARLVVATNRDLAAEVREGRFREDLFYRLNVYPIHVEPLRRRPEDTPAIVAHHLHLLAAREKRQVPRLTPAALERMVAYGWPGNVRQLVHVLTRAMILAPKNVIDAEHIDLPLSGEQQSFTRYRDAKQEFDRDYYSRLLRVANGNVASAARLAAKTRKEIYDPLKRLGLDAAPYRHGPEIDERS